MGLLARLNDSAPQYRNERHLRPWATRIVVFYPDDTVPPTRAREHPYVRGDTRLGACAPHFKPRACTAGSYGKSARGTRRDSGGVTDGYRILRRVSLSRDCQA